MRRQQSVFNGSIKRDKDEVGRRGNGDPPPQSPVPALHTAVTKNISAQGRPGGRSRLRFSLFQIEEEDKEAAHLNLNGAVWCGGG
jgi:hypothetical protein